MATLSSKERIRPPLRMPRVCFFRSHLQLCSMNLASTFGLSYQNMFFFYQSILNRPHLSLIQSYKTTNWLKSAPLGSEIGIGSWSKAQVTQHPSNSMANSGYPVETMECGDENSRYFTFTKKTCTHSTYGHLQLLFMRLTVMLHQCVSILTQT